MSIDWKHGPPRPWSAQLADPAGDGIRGVLAGLNELSPADQRFPSKELGLKGNPAAAALVTLGPEATRAILEPTVPLVVRAVEESRTLFPADPSGAGIGLLSFISAMECCAVPLPAPMAGAPAEDWLRMLASEPKLVNGDERIGTGLACLAFGIREPVPAIVGGRKLAAKFKAGEEYYDNLAGYVRYLTLALEQRASAEDVRPAWKAFVWSFPTLRAKHLVWWSDLLWAARVHYQLFEKRPVAEVGPALYAFVRTL